jgi:putative NADPH-quinone reductase
LAKRILIINGHPDPRPERFCAALAEAYSQGAAAAGHDIRRLTVGSLEFPLIRSRGAFEDMDPPACIQEAQQLLTWAEHIVLIHPLWMGSAPAYLKAFFEQTFRYGFAMPQPGEGIPHGRLGGRSARIIVTMGMPGAAYGAIFGGFGVRAVERSILRLAGIRPTRHTYVGQVESRSKARDTWLLKVRELGRRAA